MMTYDETMRYGASQYADVIGTLNARGLPAEFTQTGGICAAIMITLEAGYYLLLTDREDTLSWDRAEHEGWFVGLYEHEDRRTADGPLRYAESADGSAPAAVALVDEVLPRLARPTNDAPGRVPQRERQTRRRYAPDRPTAGPEGSSLAF
jgi:hypothetical protein